MATQVTLNSGSVDSAGSLALKTNGTTTAVTINASQGVEFNAGAVGTPSITTTGDTNTGIFFPAADTIAFSEGGVESMRINSSGNVGIGTSSPTDTSSYGRALDIQSSTGAAIYLRDSDGPTTDYGLVAYDSSIDSLTLGSVTASTGIIRLIAAGNEAARITSGGDLLVGKTSNGSTGQGSVFFPSASWQSSVNGTAFAYHALFYRNADSTPTAVGAITSSSTTTTYSTSSDYRLKENIAPMTGALSVVQALNPVTYNWKADGSDGQGFIAHELQAVVPDAVVGEKDAVDADGNPVHQGIDTSFLVATLTAALQELKALVDTQASTITALQADVAALKGTA
jgi:hypothetical protein